MDVLSAVYIGEMEGGMKHICVLEEVRLWSYNGTYLFNLDTLRTEGVLISEVS